MFYSYNYFRQYNNNQAIRDHKEFYQKFSNTREFGGNFSNLDHLIKNRFHDTLGHMYNAILRKNPQSILDIGCGDGVNLPLANLFPQKRYEGIDYAEKAIEQAKRNYSNIIFKVGDAFKLPYENKSFDMAILSSVLILYKSQEDRVKLLNEACRVLKDNGVLIVNVWNDTFVIRNSIRLSRILGRLNRCRLPQDFMGCHFKFNDVIKMVQQTEFVIKERIQTAHLFGIIECAQYLSGKKYNRNFGNEHIKEKELPLNIKEDLKFQVDNAKCLPFLWGLYKLFRNEFSWMNIYILQKVEKEVGYKSY